MMHYYWEHHRTDFIILMGIIYAVLCVILFVPRWVRNRKKKKEAGDA